MKYWIKRKYRQISTIIWWIPKIWNNFDFDYSYSTMMMVHQLERQADFLESENAHAVDAKLNASKIRTFIKLYHKVYDDEYFDYYHKLGERELRENYTNQLNKAHRILWAFFEHNIQKWWD